MSPGGPATDSRVRLVDRLAALEALLEREAEHLLAGDADAIRSVTEEKEAAFLDLQRACTGFADPQAIAGDPAVRAALERCSTRNLANGRILARLHRSTERALALLTGREEDSAGYAAGGLPERSARRRTLARA
jgi:flagellar biosynthesis/type III secretory pathway chaperone